MKRCEGKVVIITGGGRGIGRGISSAFAEEGASLVITGRTQATLDTAREELEAQYKIKVLAVPADGSDEAAVKGVVRRAAETFGRIDALINNAQTIIAEKPLVEHTSEDFLTNFKTGPMAAFYYMTAAFPYLKESKGSIINFGSGGGQNGLVDFAAYNTSKEAMRGLSRTAANEWGQYGININVVCPIVETPGMKVWEEKYPELYQSEVIRKTPMRRVGDAKKDVGRVCVFLTTEDAKYLTGQTINVDGGNILRP